MGGHCGLEGLLERARQRVSSWRGECMHNPDAKLLDAACPVGLVIMLRDDDLGCTRASGGMCGACAAMMDNGGYAWKQRLVVDLANGDAIGFLVNQRQVSPAAQKNGTATKGASGFDHHAAEMFRRTDTAKAKVNRWIPSVEKRR